MQQSLFVSPPGLEPLELAPLVPIMLSYAVSLVSAPLGIAMGAYSLLDAAKAYYSSP